MSTVKVRKVEEIEKGTDPYYSAVDRVLWERSDGGYIVTASVDNQFVQETACFVSDKDGTLNIQEDTFGRSGPSDHIGALKDGGFEVAEFWAVA